eukprot:1720559-Amphidinium_carterae.1
MALSLLLWRIATTRPAPLYRQTKPMFVYELVSSGTLALHMGESITGELHITYLLLGLGCTAGGHGLHSCAAC